MINNSSQLASLLDCQPEDFARVLFDDEAVMATISPGGITIEPVGLGYEQESYCLTYPFEASDFWDRVEWAYEGGLQDYCDTAQSREDYEADRAYDRWKDRQGDDDYWAWASRED